MRQKKGEVRYWAATSFWSHAENSKDTWDIGGKMSCPHLSECILIRRLWTVLEKRPFSQRFWRNYRIFTESDLTPCALVLQKRYKLGHRIWSTEYQHPPLNQANRMGVERIIISLLFLVTSKHTKKTSAIPLFCSILWQTITCKSTDLKLSQRKQRRKVFQIPRSTLVDSSSQLI